MGLDDAGEDVWAFEAALWSTGDLGWVFLTCPPEVGEDVALLAEAAGPRPGFGSVRVEVEIGATRWRTSVFPSRARGWDLPVKAAVRRAEGLEPEDVVRVRLALVADGD